MYYIRYFPDKNNDKYSMEKYVKVKQYNKAGVLIWTHPDTKIIYNCIIVAHQVRGLNMYFIVRGYTNSIPYILERYNDTLVKSCHTPADQYNKLFSKQFRAKFKQGLPRDSTLIITFIGLALLLIMLITIPFFPALLTTFMKV